MKASPRTVAAKKRSTSIASGLGTKQPLPLQPEDHS